MLRSCAATRFAAQRTPEREARLLCMTNAVPPGNPPEQTQTPDDQAMRERPREGQERGDDVDGARQQTREGARHTLERAEFEEEASRSRAVMEQFEEVNAMFTELECLTKDQKVRDIVQTLDTHEQESFRKFETFLQVEKHHIGWHLLTAQGIKDWCTDATTNPMAFIETMAESYRDQQGGEAVLQDLNRVGREHAEHLRQWQELGPMERLPIIAAVRRAARLQIKLSDIETKAGFYKRVFRDALDMIKEMQRKDAVHKARASSEQDKSRQSQRGAGSPWASIKGATINFFEKAGITFYSPLEIWTALKSVKEAYVKAFNDKMQLRAAVLAKDMTGMLKWAPYGEEVEIALESDLESKHGKASKEYQEHLEHNNVDWRHLFNPGELLDKLIESGEQDKAVGLLEYAASRGWLYDIDESAAKSVNEKTVFGRNLRNICPKDWSDVHINNFHTLLRGRNMAGVNDEIEKGTKRVQGIENTPFFIQEIDRELEKVNLWSAVGIAARAIERGLKAEVSPWVLTTVMRHLRESPEARRYANIVFLDKMGTLAAYRSASTLGFLKSERAPLMKWLKDGIPVEYAPAFGEVMHELERDITAACEQPPAKADLDHAVALVLAGHILNEEEVRKAGLALRLKPGTAITIFNAKTAYARYRKNPSMAAVSPADPGIKKEDTDYFTQITDNQLAGKQTVDEILKGNGHGEFEHSDKVPYWMHGILNQYYQHKTDGLDAEAEIFRREMGPKITMSLAKTALGDTRTSAMDRIELLGDGAFKGRPMLRTLITEGFLDIDEVIDTFWQNDQGKGIGLSSALLRQIDPVAFERLSNARQAKDQRTREQVRQTFFGRLTRRPNWK